MVNCYGIIPCTTRLASEIRFLCIKQHNSTSWSFPKGHPETNESIVETALREVREEVGISVQIIPNFSYSYSYTLPASNEALAKDKTVTLFLGIAQSTVVSIQYTEIETLAWLSFEQACSRIHFASIREALVQARQFLQKSKAILKPPSF